MFECLVFIAIMMILGRVCWGPYTQADDTLPATPTHRERARVIDDPEPAQSARTIPGESDDELDLLDRDSR